MPSLVLVDAGVIIGLLRENDEHHEAAERLVRDVVGTYLTTLPVLAEACAMMSARRQARVIEWVRVTDTRIVPVDDGLEFIQGYMEKYASRPCDFTDASLVYAAVKTGVRRVMTFDKTDFNVYRLPDRSRFQIVTG